MSRQVDGPLRMPADFLALSIVPPVVARGYLICGDAGCTVELPEPIAAIPKGTPVVVACTGEQAFRVLGQVASVSGNRIELDVARVVPADQRAFPRMVGGVATRYRVLAADEPDDVLAAWMAGAAPEGAWQHPDPFMDFSGSGLAFEHATPCAVGDRVLVEFNLPTRPIWWRATASVVRAEPMMGSSEQDAGSYDIALHFDDLAEGALQALMEHTLHIQSCCDDD